MVQCTPTTLPFVGRQLNLGAASTGGWQMVAARTAVAATIGGTASALSGGKFATGAITAAFLHLFNAEGFGKKFVDELTKNPSRYFADMVYNKRTGTLGGYNSATGEWQLIGEVGDWRSGQPGITDQNQKPGGPTPDGLYRILSRDQGAEWENTPGHRGYALIRWDATPNNDSIDRGLPGAGRSELRIHHGLGIPTSSDGCCVSDRSFPILDSYLQRFERAQRSVGGPVTVPYNYGGKAKSNFYYGTLNVGSW
jgi:hypothetical protein